MNGKRVTIKDLARHCKVSVSTVSYALNSGKNAENTKNAKVSEAKRREILSLAEKWDYRPNHAAKSLISRKSFRIGVMFSSLSSRSYSLLIERIQRNLADCGYAGIIASWGNTYRNETFLHTYGELLDCEIDGMILAHSDFRGLRKDIPTVIYGHQEAIGKYDTLLVSQEEKIRTAAEYLISLGHRRIAVMTHITRSDREEKWAVMRSLFPDYPREYLAPASDTVKSGIKILHRMLALPPERRPSALIAVGDESAAGVLQEAIRLGIRVPEDLSVLGSSNLPESEFTNPPLTTFSYDRELMAKKLVEMMMRRLQSPDAPLESCILRNSLLLRQSCCAPQTDLPPLLRGKKSPALPLGDERKEPLSPSHGVTQEEHPAEHRGISFLHVHPPKAFSKSSRLQGKENLHKKEKNNREKGEK